MHRRLVVVRQEVGHLCHSFVDRGAQRPAMCTPRRLDVLERHHLASVFLAHRAAEEAVAVEEPDFGQVARIVADGDGLTDEPRERRGDSACRISSRSRSSRLSGRRGRKPSPRQASSGVSPISPWIRTWLAQVKNAALSRSSRASDSVGRAAALPPTRCPGSSGSSVVVSKRFAKKQQMQWSKRGAHLLLQTRTRALDGTLRDLFVTWYPGMAANDHQAADRAAA